MTNTVRPGLSRRRSSISAALDRIHVWYWTPCSMLISFFLGLVFALGLHFHYDRLNGKDVGSLFKLQFALLSGTALAYFAQLSLAYTVRTVATQYLWKALKAQQMTVAAMDAAFSMTSNPSGLLNPEIWRKTKLATIIAILSWFIPITTFIAPATLNVKTVMRSEIRRMNTSTVDIANPDLFQRFSYTINGTTGLQRFLGPRTIVSRIALAAATTGNILKLTPPATNATYVQAFHGPYVQCSNSTPEVRSNVDEMIRRFNTTGSSSSSELVALNYFAAIPTLSNLPASASAIQAANLSNVDGALYSSNQLWIVLREFPSSLNFTTPATLNYLTCQLFNASYTSRFSWQNGEQDIDVYDLKVLNLVPYPIVEAKPTPESQAGKSYSAVMSSMVSQLIGSVAFYRDLTSSPNRIYSSIRTNIAQTVLLGSSDFNSHFVQNHYLGLLGFTDGGSTNASNTSSSADPVFDLFSDQRLQDMAYVGARPLDVLIPELSKNITISLLTDPLLASNIETNVTISRPTIVYVYQSQNIVIVYTIFITITAVVVGLGAWVFYRSRVSHDNSFSSIMCATHRTYFPNLQAHENLGALPHPRHLEKSSMRLFAGGKTGRVGFGVVAFPSPPEHLRQDQPFQQARRLFSRSRLPRWMT